MSTTEEQSCLPIELQEKILKLISTAYITDADANPIRQALMEELYLESHNMLNNLPSKQIHLPIYIDNTRV
jgi:hypothetical protein